MWLDRKNRKKLAVIGTISLTFTSVLYLASRSPSFKAWTQQASLENPLSITHDLHLSSTGTYLRTAQKATSTLNSLLEQHIEISDLEGKGLRVSTLATLLEAIIEDPTISRESFFGFRAQEFGWWKIRSKTYLPWGGNGESEVGIVMCAGLRDLVLAAQNIRTLRNVLGSILPIEVFYAGEDDFPQDEREQLEALAPNVQTVNILDFYDDSVAGIIDSVAEHGWVMKPFAMVNIIS